MRVLWLLLAATVRTASANLEYLDSEVEYQCIQHCPLQNRTDAGHYDYACDYGCNINQCNLGCKSWRKALNSSCQKACNDGPLDRLTPKELYCVMGCNDAMTKYFNQLKSKLLTPPAPALVADSLNATSLKLEWNFPEAKRVGLTYHVQWKYEELTATWHYCRNATWSNDDTVVLVENLQPYTKYRFRIVLILGHLENSIVSNPSVVISTLPSGIPVSPPSSVRVAPIDSTRISVSWEPGPFPHGPLLSYVLQITDNQPDAEAPPEVKDIPAENNFYMFRNLRPSRNYTISIKMRNGIGSGPSAKVTVSTPSEPLTKDTQQPVLILGTEHAVIEQGTDILDEPELLYSTLMTIHGIGIHINKKLLFVSDSGGHIMKMPLSKTHPLSNISYILSPYQIDFMPLDLSVDWLNDQLYILGEVKMQHQRMGQRMWRIVRCDLDGRSLTTVIGHLTPKPYNIEVDPYNGYLFWAIRGQRAGLYRLDISDISNGIKHETQPVMILQDQNLGAFTVDHTNFRLFVANQRQKTINTVSLDGKEIVNVRPNVIKSKLQNVVSLASAYKKFYWTDGDDIFYEEYHNSDYFHNSYPDLSARSYKKVIINLTSSQPIPNPVNPPTNVQAIFGRNIAKVTWQAPHLLGIQGKGAWQNWSYVIAIKEVNSQEFITHSTINTTSYKISGLKENTEYVIKVAAYTKSGKGPWSSEFRGITLGKSENPAIYWSAAKGLLKSDAAGENVETLIDKSRMESLYFIDMTWYEDQIYLVTNESHVYWYNTKTHSQGQLTDIDSVGSIAVDWIGKKLYWSNPKRQMIIRGNLNGTQQEPLPILTLAKELNIDSVKAYLYWSTGFAVRCAHLNGEDAIEYHPVQLFSGRQVMGLTLDINNKFVYWIVRGSEGSNLFRAPMAGYYTDKIVVEKISSLQKPNMQGPLCYFHKRLLWLQDDKNAAISDLQGKNIATISGKSMSDLTLVYVVDSSLHIMPDTPSITVIPEIVDKNSVRVVESSNSFNVSWDPVTNVNYGEVFYEVSIDSLSRNDSPIITSDSTVKYWQQVAPFTKLHVGIRAFTYWGTSPQIRAKVFSPASTPSVPRNLRAYVTHQHNVNADNNVTLTVRWDPPMFPNGVIKGYKIHCWYFDDFDNKNNVCENVVKDAKDFQIELKSLEKGQIYYFNLQAYNEVRDGDLSTTISVNSSKELPLPRLLMASTDSVYIQDIDTDKTESLLHGINTPIKIGYSIKESKLFWINKLQDLMMYDMTSYNKTKIIDLAKVATSLTVDWLERSLYFAQTDDFDGSSSVWKIDFNYVDKGIIKPTKVFSTPSRIGKIEVSPYTKKLYWVENSKLMVCDTDGSNRREFFQKRSLHICNCPNDAKIENTYTLDHSTESKPLLIFIDSASKNVVSTDKNGCICEVIANDTNGVTLPLQRLKSDFGTLYWTGPQGVLHTLNKNDANVVTKEVDVHDIVIFGPHMQPYPPKQCLRPKQQNDLRVQLKHKTSNSLTFQMPEISHVCNISMPTVEYRIYYKQQEDQTSCDVNCNLSVTFEKEYTITSLKPFTNYIVAVAVSNYYTEDEQVVIGPSTIFQTAVGAPSQPQNVTATVLNPTMAKVTWWPPQEFNGATVHYEIYWQTERTLSGVRQKEQPNVEQQFSPNSTQFLTTVLNKLSPNETYTVWVRAYSETNETSSDSEKVQINTYPEPSDLVLVNRSAYVLKLTWEVYPHIASYNVQISPITSNEWEDIIIDKNTSDVVIVKEDLKPKTQYKFRLCLFYENYSEEYIWPQDSRFTYETLGDKPSPPGTPKIQYVKPNIYKVFWEASKDNGAPIELYKLEGLELPNYRNKRSTNRPQFFETAPSVEEEEREWQPFYNGTETSWIIDGLSEKYKYEFRALALNVYGWSDPSESSTTFDLNEAARMAEKQSPMTLIAVATFIPVSVFLVILLCIVCRKYSKPKKVQVVSIPRGPDVELATLRELPRRGVHNTNVLYVSTQQSSDELTLLPHIRRDQITLMKFLGSGAFGEVFEGKARGISNATGETKVAVKTLRKGATDQEKTEFLQEAQLMSNFKHEHILQLLGVCLDNDPHFIIMELMQGGDLLTYLRSSRNPNMETPSLTLIELLKMCVDVAKGCRYLEEMHFVHRDLACRNCLVSSNDSDRIVKIGDFGLARDIYKNDYYRKEGEGLLPVRWMAPESLVDGVFTSQSDVWAFGVLLWEIMTLGQQPYPARNNLEVLHYVRRGGRLGKPADCPETLHNLMLKCWEFEADKRPTFKYCLDILENLHFQKLRSPTTGAHEGQYISTVQESDVEDEANREKTPFLASEATPTIPKYLELLYEPDTPPPNDGYEIPNQMLAGNSKRNSSIVSLNNETSKIQCNGNVPQK